MTALGQAAENLAAARSFDCARIVDSVTENEHLRASLRMTNSNRRSEIRGGDFYLVFTVPVW